MNLTQEEKDHLKEIARLSIQSRLEHTPGPVLSMDSEILRTNCGAFVTLKIGGQLRGCIGLIAAMKPLYESVIEMAQAAAFDDPRFEPLTKSELNKIDIEISVLSPLRVIDNLDEIEVGRHGIIIRRGYHSGLLLPQVATDYNWDRETFLRHTCLKAGLPFDAYLDPKTEIQIFTAEVF
jgi:AmmeMemoRadiSam system protein A